MGLDAFVYCRCWQDGRTAPPPAGPVGFDDDGYLDLLLPWEENRAAHAAFNRWLLSACPHDKMELASERVANWSGYRLFQEALGAVGWSHFPTLHAQLPEANGGSMPAAASAAALEELDFFEARSAAGDRTVLVDEGTGQAVMTYVAAHGGVTMLGPAYRAGVDPDGFFVLDPGTDPPSTLFRAARFEQRVLSGGVLELTGDGHTVRVAMPPVGGDEAAVPHRLAVRQRPQSAGDFGYVVGSLRRLCEASVASGNPVMWC